MYLDMRDIEVVEMPWPKTGATHYHAQLGFPDYHAIKGLGVCKIGI